MEIQDGLPANNLPSGTLRKNQNMVNALTAVYEKEGKDFQEAVKNIKSEEDDNKIFLDFVNKMIEFTLDKECENFFKLNYNLFTKQIPNQKVLLHILDAFGIEDEPEEVKPSEEIKK